MSESRRKQHGSRSDNVLIVLILFCIIICSGCYSEINKTVDHGKKDTEPKYRYDADISVKNSFTMRQQAALAQLSAFPVEKGFYWFNGPLWFYDVSSAEKLCACAVAGCQHVDNSCPAVVPNCSCFWIEGTTLYAFSDAEEGLMLVVSDLKTGKKNSKVLIKNDSRTRFDIGYAFFSQVWIIIHGYRSDDAGQKAVTYVYENATENLVKLIEDDETSDGTPLGVYGKYLLVSWKQYEESVLEYEAFINKYVLNKADMHSLFEQYREYLQSIPCTREKRLYDLETMTYTDILKDLQGDSDLYPDVDFSSSYSTFGEYILYTLGNQVLRYNMVTGEREVLVEREHVVNGFLWDGKLLYIVSEDGACTIFIYDPESGETVQLKNNGNTKYTEFGIHNETKDAFIGIYNESNAWILKEDYYNERYDKAVVYRRY